MEVDHVARLSGHIFGQVTIIEHFGILIAVEHITVRKLILAGSDLRYVVILHAVLIG